MNALYPSLFLSIGAMKAGTTWLYALLGRHPALHVTMEKEVHYFYHRYVDPGMLSDAYRLREVRNRYLLRFDPEKANIDAVRANLHWISAYLSRPVDDHWYRNLFQIRGHERYACDFSNLNAQLPREAWEQIAARSPRLRVLYTMRDPAQRLWSHVKFHLQVTGEVASLDSWGPDDFAEFARRPHIWVNAEYGGVLRRMRSALAPEMWKAIFYEELHADQRGSLRGIEEFLGLPPFDYPQELLERRFTEGLPRKMPAFFPALFADEFARIRREVQDEGFSLPPSWG
ncbi:MAG: sulfotransferase [Sulfitobacter sp.]|nr:sulfotransferase [Sulfitobacter sp.]